MFFHEQQVYARFVHYHNANRLVPSPASDNCDHYANNDRNNCLALPVPLEHLVA